MLNVAQNTLVMRHSTRKARRPRVISRQTQGWLEKIGFTIQELRDQKHLNQEGLAESSGVGTKTLSDLENGSRGCGIDVLIDVLTALEKDIWTMFGGVHTNGTKRPIEQQVLYDLLDRFFKSASDADLNSVKTILRNLTRARSARSITHHR